MEFNEDEFEVFFLEGWDLDVKEIQKLDNELKDNPETITARIKVLGYFRKQLLDTENNEYEQKYLKHLKYLIKKIPQSSIFSSPLIELQPELDFDQRIFNQLKPIWQKHLAGNNNNYNLLINSGTFFLPFEEDLAESLFFKANTIEPNDLDAIENIARVYNLKNGGINSETKKENITNLLEQLRLESITVSGSRLIEKISKFISMLDTALSNNMLDEISEYSDSLKNLYQQLLTDGAQDEDLIHDVNIILGKIEFELGNFDLSTAYLLKAGNVQGSARLSTFGPDMELAQKLLDYGKSGAVLSYLELCKSFWELGADKIDEWILLIKNGRSPKISG